MAIKFSQFTVRTSSSDLSHIVGYNGADNIQITPTNFLNSALTGTAGQVLFYDTTGVAGDNDLYWDNSNKRLGIGVNAPSSTLHVKSTGNGEVNIERASGTLINLQAQAALGVIGTNSNHDLAFKTNSNVGIRLTTGGNVGIGLTSPSEKLEVVGNIKVGDSEQFIAGAGNDLKIYHNGVNSVIESDTGNLALINTADNRDILFQSDNGSGGTATYFFLDGGNTRTEFLKDVKFPDNVKANFGTSVDLQIWHDGSNSYISNEGVGNINIQNTADDKDIIFKSDNGSGGTTEYFRVDGGFTKTIFSQDIWALDNVKALYGSSSDLQILHDATNSLVRNYTGDLFIDNYADDSDIKFRSDDGTGSVTEYFRLDGSTTSIVVSAALGMYFNDGVAARFGTGGDLIIYHNGTNSLFENSNGHIYIKNSAVDKDIIFEADNGSGGLVEYFKLDGTNKRTKFSEDILIADTKILRVGSGADLQIKHNGTDSYIENYTGAFNIVNYSDDQDIKFWSDDGSGGVAEYFRLDGSSLLNIFSKDIRLMDSVRLNMGDQNDLHLRHNGTNGFMTNSTGDLYITNEANDKDIIFRSDDGSGSVATYFKLDGATSKTIFETSTRHKDSVKANFGDGEDLQIYHNGSNSFISDTGVGLLVLSTNHLQVYNSSITEVMITAVENGAVNLYYDNVKKLETTTTGIKITGVSEYADNTAAIAGGLTTGDVYRTGDLLKIVH